MYERLLQQLKDEEQHNEADAQAHFQDPVGDKRPREYEAELTAEVDYGKPILLELELHVQRPVPRARAQNTKYSV